MYLNCLFVRASAEKSYYRFVFIFSLFKIRYICLLNIVWCFVIQIDTKLNHNNKHIHIVHKNRNYIVKFDKQKYVLNYFRLSFRGILCTSSVGLVFISDIICAPTGCSFELLTNNRCLFFHKVKLNQFSI